jgi:hypothetical protein
MAFLVIAAVAYLACAVLGTFFLVVTGIRCGDRAERIIAIRSCTSGDSTRRVLHSGSWPEVPVYRPGSADN